MSKSILVAGFAIALVLSGCLGPQTGSPVPGGTDAKPVIRIAIAPTSDASAIEAQAKDFERFLENRTGFDVRIFVPLTYTGVIEALRFGHAEVALMSAFPAALANKVAGSEIVLAERREVIVDNQPTVAPFYYSYYVVLKESHYHGLSDLAGKKAAFPSLTSTSGYLFPIAKLVEKGLVPMPAAGKEADPKAFFGSTVVGGGYAGAWQALKNGQADVGVIAGDVSATLFNEVLAATRIVETQGPVPSHGVVFAKAFTGTQDAEKLKAALLELKGEHKELMRKLVSAIFVEFAETNTTQHTAALADAIRLSGLKLSETIG